MMRNAGFKPVFDSLPDKVVPFAYPFYSAANQIGTAKQTLKKIDLECFPWPELPDAIFPKAPEHYRSVWMVGFLW